MAQYSHSHVDKEKGQLEIQASIIGGSIIYNISDNYVTISNSSTYLSIGNGM